MYFKLMLAVYAYAIAKLVEEELEQTRLALRARCGGLEHHVHELERELERLRERELAEHAKEN